MLSIWISVSSDQQEYEYFHVQTTVFARYYKKDIHVEGYFKTNEYMT